MLRIILGGMYKLRRSVLQKKLSIIIAMYNAEDTIENTLKSIYPRREINAALEVLIVDDGSTDQSKTIVQKWANRIYTDITVLDGNHQGVSHARNLAINAAEGKYLTFMDSDDQFSNNNFSKITDFFDAHFKETDIITYPLVYVNSYSADDITKYGFPSNQTQLNVDIDPETHEPKYSKRLLAAKQKLFSNGTAIYNVDNVFWLGQKTVNVVIKNLRLIEGETPIYFEEDIPNGEDSMFMTRYVEQKHTIGYFNKNGFQYLYFRRGDSTVQKFLSPVDSYEMVLIWAKRMIELNKREDGTLSKYVQAIILDEFGWRIKSTNFYPLHLSDEDYAEWESQIKEILQYISIDVLRHGLAPNPTMPRFVLNNLIELRGDVEVQVSEDERGLDFYQDDQLVLKERHFETILSGAEFQNGKLHLDAAAKHAFSDLYETTPFYILNGQRFDFPETYISAESYYMQKHKTHRLVGFKADIDLSEVQEGQLRIGYEIMGHEFFPDLMFIRNTRLFSDKLKLNHASVEDKDFTIDYKHFVIDFTTGESAEHKLSTAFATLDAQGTDIVDDLTLLTDTNDAPIWLYADTIGKTDNAYTQFKHDIELDDGVERRYVVHEGFEEYVPDYETYQDNFVEFGSIEHKRLFLNANVIIAAFQGIDTFAPYTKGDIVKVRGMFNLNVVYLQHGLLHAKIDHIYSKERVDFYRKWVVSSQMEFDELVKNYHLDEKQIIKSGMPRFANRNTTITPKNLNRILYAPSWRRNLMVGQTHKGSGWQPNEGLMKKSIIIKAIEELYENTELNDWLRSEGVQIDIKLHPIMADFVTEYLTDTDTIKVVKSVDDMSVYDLFVTDYSSFMYDAVAENVPVLLYQPDYNYFVDGVHTFTGYVTPSDRTLADQVFSFDEFFSELQAMKENPEELNKHLPDYEGFLQVSDNPMQTIYENVFEENFGKMRQINLSEYVDIDARLNDYIESQKEAGRLNFEDQQLHIATKRAMAIFNNLDMSPDSKMISSVSGQTNLDVYGITNKTGELVLVSPIGFITGSPNWVSYSLSDLTKQRLIEQLSQDPEEFTSSLKLMNAQVQKLEKNEIEQLNANILKRTKMTELPTMIVVQENNEAQVVNLTDVKWDAEGNVILETELGEMSQKGKRFIAPRQNIDEYIVQLDSDKAAVTTKTVPVYKGLDFSDGNKLDQTVEKTTKLVDAQIVWTAGGTPRIKYQDGFITANKEYITFMTDEQFQKTKLLHQHVLVRDDAVQTYEANKVYDANVSVETVTEVSKVDDETYELTLDSGKRIKIDANDNIQMVRDDFADFLYSVDAPTDVMMMKRQAVYNQVAFNDKTKTETFYLGNEVIEVQGVTWTQAGTPRLVTEDGYISSNLKNVTQDKAQRFRGYIKKGLKSF